MNNASTPILPLDTSELRRKAEQKVVLSPEHNTCLSLNETRRMIHELRVHQIELEMQNEDLRQTQAELNAVCVRYFDLYDLAPAGYITLGKNGLIQEANRYAATLLGMPRGKLVGQRISKFLRKGDQDAYYLFHKQIFETDETQTCELRMDKSDGSPFWGRLSAAFTRNADNEPVCRMVLIDITERKQMEERLREQEENYRTLADFGRALIWTSGTNKKCDYFNQTWLRFTGRTLEQEFGDGWTDGVHPDDLARCFKIYTEAFDRREPFSMDYRLRHHDGEFRWILDEGAPRHDSRGNFLGYIGHCLDITERKRAQEELIKLDKLQSVGLLAGGIAHDFNNILQGLYGNIAMAMEEHAETHPSYELLEEAGKSITRAVRLTKQLLTFAKGGDPVKARVNLGATVEDVVRFDLTGSNVSLVYQSAEDLWPVDADEGQIQQVVSNLVINARQAMPKGGHLYVTLENADLPAEAVPSLKQGLYIRFILRDEGCGIEPTLIDNIFDPYFTTKQTGSGLGLATVWAIITKHNGQIGVVSEFGKGTTFTIYLPASAAPQSAEAKQHPVAECLAPVRSAKILVMDDEASVCSLVVRMLKPFGYFVATAPNGQETVALYKQALEDGVPFDAVIMDLTIPGGPGGEETIKDLLALDPNVRAIVSSGYAVHPVIANFAAYGFKGNVSKPYTSEDLRYIVARLLQEHKNG